MQMAVFDLARDSRGNVAIEYVLVAAVAAMTQIGDALATLFYGLAQTILEATPF